jgi:glycosyltransferase involved in cell wall biosynthesis
MDVSIVITTYNYSGYVESCIKSCLNQLNTRLSYEIIVVDDGSTDDTSEVLKLYSSYSVRVFRIENSGIEIASNFGFSKATGDYIVRVDADDLLLPNYLASMENVLSNEYGFFYSNYQVIDGNDRVLKNVCLPDFDSKEILSRGDFLATGTLIRADILNHFGPYKCEIVNSGLENYEFIIHLLCNGVRGLHVSEELFSYRRHSKNISKIKRDAIIQNGRLLFGKNNLGPFLTNEFHPYDLKVN